MFGAAGAEYGRENPDTRGSGPKIELTAGNLWMDSVAVSQQFMLSLHGPKLDSRPQMPSTSGPSAAGLRGVPCVQVCWWASLGSSRTEWMLLEY